MTNPAISVRGIEKSYKDLHVLRGVDFEVEPGGFVSDHYLPGNLGNLVRQKYSAISNSYHHRNMLQFEMQSK